MATEGELDRVVHQYLQHRNYKAASKALEEESPVVSLSEMVSLSARKVHADSAVANQVAAFARGDGESGAGAAEVLEDNYTALNKWIETSLDQYRAELYTVMYPIFVHCYLDLVARGQTEDAKKFMVNHCVEHEQYHRRELEELKGVTTPEHMARSEFVSTFRRAKYNLVLCSYSFELLLAYVQEQKFMTILSIINQHLEIKVFSGKPNQKYEAFGMTGTMSTELETLNKKEIYWGQLRVNEVEEALDDDDDDEPVKPGESDADGGGGAEGARARKRAKRRHLATIANGPKQDRVPLPELKGRALSQRIEQLKEMRQRVTLGRGALPSACMYTLFNTAGRLHCLSPSPDACMMAGGFADSYVKVWDLTGRGLTSLKPAHVLKDMDITASTSIDDLKDPDSAEDVKTLVGHTGPVYDAQFSPDNAFLLTGSEDGTARLWDLHTFSNVVVYKGHMYPIWGVAFAPLGHYFATASHDRTARVWRTDHVYPLRVLAGHLSDVNSVAFHPNCNYVATASSDRSCRLWDVQTGDCVRVFEGHADAVHALAFSECGQYMASGGDDASVVLWDLGSGRRVRTFKGHTDVIHSVCFSGEGTLIASGSADCTVRLRRAHS